MVIGHVFSRGPKAGISEVCICLSYNPVHERVLEVEGLMPCQAGRVAGKGVHSAPLWGKAGLGVVSPPAAKGITW